MKRSPLARKPYVPTPQARERALERQRKPRKALPAISKAPKRAQRRQAGSQHAQEHHAAVQHCEAPGKGILTPCGGHLEHSHRIGKGMGGGRDYAVTDGECDILCQNHHKEIDTNRARMVAAGLYKRRPA